MQQTEYTRRTIAEKYVADVPASTLSLYWSDIRLRTQWTQFAGSSLCLDLVCFFSGGQHVFCTELYSPIYFYFIFSLFLFFCLPLALCLLFLFTFIQTHTFLILKHMVVGVTSCGFIQGGLKCFLLKVLKGVVSSKRVKGCLSLLLFALSEMFSENVRVSCLQMLHVLLILVHHYVPVLSHLSHLPSIFILPTVPSSFCCHVWFFTEKLGRWKVVWLLPTCLVTPSPPTSSSFFYQCWSSCTTLFFFVFFFLSLHSVRGQAVTLFVSRLCSCRVPVQPRAATRSAFQPHYRSPSTHPSRTEIQTHIPDRSPHLPPSLPPPHFFLFSASPLFLFYGSLHLFLSYRIHQTHTHAGLKVAMTSRPMNK